MKRAKTQEEKYRQMTEMPVSKLIPGLAVPTIISMLISSVYNMADTFFVSQLGTSASGAVGVIFSAMAIIQAIGFGFGQGAGIFISQSLGNRNTEKAGEAAAASFFAVMIIGVFIGVVGNIFLNPLVMLLGATPTIAPYAEDYAMYILIASPFMMSSFVMNNILRAQGNAVYAMVGITVGGVLNMVLDPLFIFTFGMGTAGAAVATGLSQFISFCILLAQCNLQADCISIRLKNFKPSLKMYGTILHAGFPSFCRQSIASLGTITLNFAAGAYGDAAIAAMSIVSRFMMFINSAMLGFGQGFQPVCGFNFGARRYDRVLEAFWFCVKVSVVMLAVLAVACFIPAEGIITLFRRNDPDVIEIGTRALRCQLLVAPAMGWSIMTNMMTQSIGYGFRASVLAVSRQGLFLIPALLLLPEFLGLWGVLVAQPVADVFTVLLSTVIVAQILRELKALDQRERAVS